MPLVFAQDTISVGETKQIEDGSIKLVSIKTLTPLQSFFADLFGSQLISVKNPQGTGIGKLYGITLDTKVNQQPGKAFIYISKGTTNVASYDVTVPVSCGSFPCRIQAYVKFVPKTSGTFTITTEVRY